MMLKKEFCLFILIAFSLNSCDFFRQSNGSDSFIHVDENNQVFSTKTLESSPGEKIEFFLQNNMQNSFRFLLLKKDEDPILVQHIRAQQGKLESSYYLYVSPELQPKDKIKVSFNAPAEVGTYSFLALSETPKESLVGELKVEEKMIKKVEQEEAP